MGQGGLWRRREDAFTDGETRPQSATADGRERSRWFTPRTTLITSVSSGQHKPRPGNFVTLKHMAANVARKKPGRDSLRLRLKTAAWDDDYLAKLIAA